MATFLPKQRIRFIFLGNCVRKSPEGSQYAHHAALPKAVRDTSHWRQRSLSEAYHGILHKDNLFRIFQIMKGASRTGSPLHRDSCETADLSVSASEASAWLPPPRRSRSRPPRSDPWRASKESCSEIPAGTCAAPPGPPWAPRTLPPHRSWG